MKSLILVSVPGPVVDGYVSDPINPADECKRWTDTVKGIVNGTHLFLAGNCERAEVVRHAILGGINSFTIPMCKWKMTDHIDRFATRFTGGTGILIVHRDFARAYMNDVLQDAVMREKVLGRCNGDCDVFQLTLHELGLLVSLQEATSHKTIADAHAAIVNGRLKEAPRAPFNPTPVPVPLPPPAKVFEQALAIA